MSLEQIKLGKNGLLKCYNLFPGYFADINEMTDYLIKLKEIGINVVWLNPVQLAGNNSMSKTDALTGNAQRVTKSLYAMHSTFDIDPRFSVVKRDDKNKPEFTEPQLAEMALDADLHKKLSELGTTNFTSDNFLIELNSARDNQELQNACVRFCDHQALKRFTQEAKRLGITPIFDLVTNHVAKGAPITVENPSWFGEDGTYLDAVAFKYADLLDLVRFSKDELDSIVAQITQDDLKKLATTIKADLLNSSDNAEEQRLFKSGLVHRTTKNRLLLLAFLNNHQAELAPYKEKILNGELSLKTDINLVKALNIFIDTKERDWLLEQAAKQYTSYKEMRKHSLELIDTITQKFWDPFISQYVELGFSGARVDCVRKVPLELRKKLYDKLKEKIAIRDLGSPSPVVILEEALFSDLSPEQFKDVVQDAGATHITGSLFNAQRQWHGGFAHDHAQEEFFKQQMATQGVINFTGNHDHYSCAMKVCYNLAREELDALFKDKTTFAGKTIEQYYQSGNISHAAHDIRDAIFLHSFVRDIIARLQAGEDKLIKRFGKNYRDMMLSMMFQGSGGYYMLSGDELGSFKQPTVFERDNGKPLYPQESYAFLSDASHALYAVAQEVLTESAIALAKKSSDKATKDFFREVANDDRLIATQIKEKLLSAFKAQILNELNADVEKTKDSFINAMKEKYYLKAYHDGTHPYHAQALSSQPQPKGKNRGAKAPVISTSEPVLNTFFSNLDVNDPFRNMAAKIKPSNRTEHGWEIAKRISSEFANPAYFAEVNAVLDALPPSEPGYWSEIFKARDENLLIVARKNGPGFSSETDLVFINLNPYKTLDITKEDLEKCALWFQQRKFPNAIQGQVNVEWDNPEYHKAYGAIMGHSDYKQKPPKLYFVGNLTVNQDIRDHAVTIDEQQEKFSIVVEPKPAQHPLILDKPEVIISEEDDDILQEVLSTTTIPSERFKGLFHHYEAKQSSSSSSAETDAEDKVQKKKSQITSTL